MVIRPSVIIWSLHFQPGGRECLHILRRINGNSMNPRAARQVWEYAARGKGDQLRVLWEGIGEVHDCIVDLFAGAENGVYDPTTAKAEPTAAKAQPSPAAKGKRGTGVLGALAPPTLTTTLGGMEVVKEEEEEPSPMEGVSLTPLEPPPPRKEGEVSLTPREPPPGKEVGVGGAGVEEMKTEETKEGGGEKMTTTT